MRMWKVDPRLLCRRHLLGEHAEMHMFAGCLRRGMPIEGYVAGGLVEVGNIGRRHDELAAEMARRGMNHDSPLALPPQAPRGNVDPARSLAELMGRCPECRRRTQALGVWA